jgi:hypothetical protein
MSVLTKHMMARVERFGVISPNKNRLMDVYEMIERAHRRSEGANGTLRASELGRNSTLPFTLLLASPFSACRDARLK